MWLTWRAQASTIPLVPNQIIVLTFYHLPCLWAIAYFLPFYLEKKNVSRVKKFFKVDA